MQAIETSKPEAASSEDGQCCAPLTNPLGRLLSELRTKIPKRTPQKAAALLRQALRERVTRKVTQEVIRDWESGQTFPEPLLLTLYLEKLEAPPELFNQVETVLKELNARELALLVAAVLPAPGGAPASQEQLEAVVRREAVQQAAMLLQHSAFARGLAAEAVARLGAAAGEQPFEARGAST